MDPVLNAAPERRRDEIPRWAKVLFGVLIGCGVLAVVGLVATFVAGGVGIWWLMTPGAQAPTARVVGPDCQAVVHLGDLAGDAQASAAIARIFEELQRQSRARRRRELPENLRWIEGFSQGRMDRQTLGLFLPSEATVAFEQRPGSPAFVAAVNFRAYARMVKTMLGVSKMQRVSGVDGELYRSGSAESQAGAGSVFGFYQSTLLFADHLEAAREAMKRLAREDSTALTGRPIEARLRRLQQGDGLVIAVAEAAPLRARFEPESQPVLLELLASAQWLELSGRFASVDEVLADVAIDHESADAASQAPTRVAALSAAWQESLADDGLTLEVSSEVHGTRSDSRWRVSGLEGALIRRLEEAQSRRGSGTPAPPMAGDLADPDAP